MRSLPRPLGIWLLLVLATASVLWLQAPPAPIPASAPAEVFSAERALVQVRAVARAPHPLGSAEHDRVRDHLVAALQQLGFSTRIQKDVVHGSQGRGRLVLATVENIIAERPGTNPTGTLLLAAHYDTHGTGPGAADDGAGVATLLEAARALGTGRNTLRILITDAEEVGLLGARAYVGSLEQRTPTLVLNLEARGGGGPVFMFETSDRNLPLIRAFATAAPSPHASSLTYALYKLLPNDTDLTVFKKAGMAGLNFAFVDRWSHYHTALDTPEGLDLRSLQQEGATVLALGRHFLAADLATLTQGTGDAIYFDLLGRVLLWYPATLVWPLTLLALAAFGALLWCCRRDVGLLKGFFLGLALSLGTLVLGALVGWGLGRLADPFRQGVPNHDPYGITWFEAALALLALAAAVLAWNRALRRTEGRGLALGALAWWLAALVATTALLPAASYFFLWPLLFALAGLWWERPWLAALPLLLLLPPLWHNLALLLGFSLPPFLGALAAFGLVPLLPLLRRALPARAWLPPALLAAIGVLCFAVGTGQTGPHLSTLAFVQDADAGTAQWVSFQQPDVWTRSLLGLAPTPTRLGGRSAFAGTAPALRLPVPALQHTGRELRVTLPKKALAVSFSSDVPTALSLDGRPLPTGGPLLWFAPAASFTLTVDAPPGARLSLEMILPGLPTGTPPRPAGLMPAPVDPYTDVQIVRRTLVW